MKLDKETAEKISNIEKWVKQGHSQSPSNCRVLLNEIRRLRTVIKHSDAGSSSPVSSITR